MLGPLLFLIYINDLLMYADDTIVYCNVKQNRTADVINGGILQINQWLTAYKLSLIVSKLNLCFFICITYRSVSFSEFQINGNKIERVTEFNLFWPGFTIKSNLE